MAMAAKARIKPIEVEVQDVKSDSPASKANIDIMVED